MIAATGRGRSRGKEAAAAVRREGVDDRFRATHTPSSSLNRIIVDRAIVVRPLVRGCLRNN